MANIGYESERLLIRNHNKCYFMRTAERALLRTAVEVLMQKRERADLYFVVDRFTVLHSFIVPRARAAGILSKKCIAHTLAVRSQQTGGFVRFTCFIQPIRILMGFFCLSFVFARSWTVCMWSNNITIASHLVGTHNQQFAHGELQ